jgi:putative transposase
MDDRLCLLVIIGSDENGRKEPAALADGYRESAASWAEVLTNLRQRGLKTAPELATWRVVLPPSTAFTTRHRKSSE